MKKNIVVVLMILIFFAMISPVSAGYNGQGNNSTYKTNTSCDSVYNSFCQFDNGNHKTIKITLYYFNDKGNRKQIGVPVYFHNLDDGKALQVDIKNANINAARTETIGTVFTFEELYRKLYPNNVFYSSYFDTYDEISSKLKKYVKQKNTEGKTHILEYLIGLLTENSYTLEDLKKEKESDYGYRIIVEPVVTLLKKGNYYAFTVKYLASLGYDSISNDVHWTNDPNSRNFPEMLITDKDDAGITAYACDNIDRNNIKNLVASNKSGCGYNIIDISDYIKVVPNCKIGVNNNSEVKYNWITYQDDKYVPVEGGCCSTYKQYGISEDDVLKNYPQCFGDITKYCLDGNKKVPGTCSLRRTYTSADNKPSSSYETYCLASQKYYGGVIDSDKRILYGCYYSDELGLPGYYQGQLGVGNHFIWPTDDTLLQVVPVNLNYVITRKSVATCYAYTVNENSGLSSPYNSKNISISKIIIDRVRNKIKDSRTITLKQNNNAAGILNYSESSSNFSALDNGYFKVEIDGVYRQNSSHEDAYRYYDEERLKYLTNAQVNKLNDDKRKTLYKYPYMFLPIDKDFDIKNSYTYGIDYATEFSDIKLSGSYSCSNDVKIPPPICRCPVGTENAGLDLSNYYVATNHGECKDVGKKAICYNLIDEYCNSKNISYKCPNRDFDLTECVRNEMVNNSSLIASMAYNKCVYEKCNCNGDNCDYKKICPDPDGDPVKEKIIYRTIFLNDPFPSIESDGRFPGSNWGGKKSLVGGKYTGLVKKYIIDTKEYMYDKEPMYNITLTPSVIRKIKTYNSVNGYDDFNLECQNGGKCYSEFIHEILPGYEGNIVNGTCGMINSNQSFYNNFDSCRQNSFNN